MSRGLQPNAPGVNAPRSFMGLPTSGAFGTEPALSVAGIMGILAVVVGLVTQFTGLTVPPDLQAFLDTNGSAMVSLVIAAYVFITGYLTRQRVVAPATASAAVAAAAAPRTGGATQGSIG